MNWLKNQATSKQARRVNHCEPIVSWQNPIVSWQNIVSWKNIVSWQNIPLLILLGLTGCNAESYSGPIAKTKPPTARPTKVVAQGQLLPAGGLIRLVATPGDTVEQITVDVGDAVVAGQKLLTMRSFKLYEARIEALQSRYKDAQQQKASAIEQSLMHLAAAEAKIQQSDLQTKALERQAAILNLAEKQVAASENIYSRLQSIVQDPLTSSFVGTMQLAQQRIAIDESELKYRQHAENFAEAEAAASLGAVVAEQEWKAAKSALQAAKDSLALSAIDAEMKALQVQQQSAFVVAPQDAVVVALNTRVGEAAGQFPLVELADVTKTVCDAEVVETDAALIEPQQSVTISSPALPHPLRGKVLRRGSLVGRPQLALADPLAKVDYRSVNVTIEINQADVPIASKWLHLQVNVEIEVTPLGDPQNQSAVDNSAPQL